MMSAVTISNNETRAIAHLIGNNQLPLPSEVSFVSILSVPFICYILCPDNCLITGISSDASKDKGKVY